MVTALAKGQLWRGAGFGLWKGKNRLLEVALRNKERTHRWDRAIGGTDQHLAFGTVLQTKLTVESILEIFVTVAELDSLCQQEQRGEHEQAKQHIATGEMSPIHSAYAEVSWSMIRLHLYALSFSRWRGDYLVSNFFCLTPPPCSQ